MRYSIPKPDIFPIGQDLVPLVMQTGRALGSVLGVPRGQHINTWTREVD